MEAESVEAVEPQTETVAQAEPVVEAQPEPAREEPPKPAEQPNQPPKWALERINEETNKRRQEAERREAAEREAQTLREMIARLQKGDKPAETAAQPHSQPRADQRYTQDDVRAEAARQRFYEDTVAVRNAGLSAFPNFAETLNVLNAVGATQEDMIADIMATVGRDQTHAFLHKIAQDPEKAANLAKMDSRARIAQLTRMTMAESQPAPKPVETPKPAAVSKAPPPKPALDPAAAVMSDPNDLMDDNISDDEFHRRWRKKYLRA